MMKFRITVLTIIFSQNLIQVSDGMGKPPHPPGHGRGHCLRSPHHPSHSSHHTSHGSHHLPQNPTRHLQQAPPEPRRRCFSEPYGTLYDNVKPEDWRSRSHSYSPPKPMAPLRDEDILKKLVDDPWAKFSESCEGGIDSTPPPCPCRPRSRIRLGLSFGRGRDRNSSPDVRRGRSTSRGRKPKKTPKKDEDDDGWEDASSEFTFMRCSNR